MGKAELATLLASLEDAAQDHGFELVDLELAGAGRYQTLRIYLDKAGGLTLDDLVDANVWISALLEDADPLAGSYTLEVSSPGVNRPLRTIEHFQQAVGERVRLKLSAPPKAASGATPPVLLPKGQEIGTADQPCADQSANGDQSEASCCSTPKAGSGAKQIARLPKIKGDGSVGKGGADQSNGSRRQYTGRLLAVDPQAGLIELEVDGDVVRIAHSSVVKAHVQGQVDFGSRKEV